MVVAAARAGGCVLDDRADVLLQQLLPAGGPHDSSGDVLLLVVVVLLLMLMFMMLAFMFLMLIAGAGAGAGAGAVVVVGGGGGCGGVLTLRST